MSGDAFMVMNSRVTVVAATMTLFLLVCDRPGLAQSGFSGYVVGGFGSTSDVDAGLNRYAGGGVEVVSRLGLGAGVDAGVFVDHSGVVLMLLSVDGVLQLRRASDGAIPFLAAGFTGAITPEPSFTAWNVGAGIMFVRGPGTAWRVDFRDHVRSERWDTSHYWVLRAGIAFR